MDFNQRIKELAGRIAVEANVDKLRKLIEEFQLVVAESSLPALNRAFYLSHMPVQAGLYFSARD